MSATDAAHRSGYRLMWSDVRSAAGHKKQMRGATRFREFLLDEGFELGPLLVHAGICNGKDACESYLRRMEANLLEEGEVHALTFTDRQYERIVQ